MAEENYTSKFKVDISDLKKGITEANKTIKTATAEFKNATAGMDKWSDSADGLSAKIKQQETVVEAEKKKLELLKEQLARLNQNQEDGKNIISELTQKYESACENYGKTSDEAKAYAKQLTDAEAAQERNAKAAEELKLKIINQDTAVKNAEAQVSKYQSALENLQNHTETLTEKVQRQQSELDDLKQKYANVAAEQGKESEEAKELASRISELSGELKENQTKLSEAEKAADEFDESLEDVGDSADETTSGGLSAFGKALENLAAKALTLVIDKLKEMVVQTGKVGMEFDSAMSQVAGTFGYTVEQLSDDTSEMSEAMQDLRDYSKEIATTTKFSATEVAEGMNYAAMAGWKSGEILEGYKGIVDLAAASGEELALTADIVTDGLTAMGYSASDASHFADVMAKTSANANTNVSIMGESFKYSATVAGLFGKEADGTNRKVENLALGLGLMANAGIKGSQSGNALKNSLSRLADPTDEQAVAMEQLGLAITEMKNVIDPEEVEKAQKAYEKAADTLQKAGSKVSDKTFDLQQKQLAYNTAVAKYGEDSSQAQSAMLKLQQAEIHLTDAQDAQLSAQNALAESQEALTLAQQGTMKAVATGETAFANADGSMKSLKEVYDALRSSMSAVNVELIDSEGNMRDADDIINELSQSEEGLTQAEQLRNASVLFGKQNLAGMLAIINASEEDYNKLTEAIYNSDGAAEDMADTMIDNLGGDLTILGSKLQAIQIEIYEKFEPALRKIAEKVGEVMDTILEKIDVVYPVIENAVNWVVDHGAELMATIAGVATAVGTFMLIINKQAIITAFTTGLSTITKAFGLLNTTMLANPVGLIVAAIAGLVVAFAVLWNKSDKFRNFWINLWESIKSTFSGFIDSIVIGWETISNFFSDAWDSFKVGWNSIIDSVKKIWNDFTDSIKIGWDTISGFFSDAWDSFKVGWNSIIDFFKNLWDGFQESFQIGMDSISNFFHSVSEKIKNFFQPVITFFTEAWNIIGELAQGCSNLISAIWEKFSEWLNTNVITPVKEFFENLFTGIKDFALETVANIKTGWQVITNWFNDVIITPIKNFFESLFTGIKDFALETVDNIKTGWKSIGTWFYDTVITPVRNFFESLFTNIKNFALETVDNIKNGWKIIGTWFNTNVITPIKNFFTGMWTGIKNGAVQAWEGIKTTFAHIADWFHDKFSTAWQKVKDIFSAGGEVFAGIKDGILSAFKNVVNGLIRGINTIIAIPFNAINDTLDRISTIDIAGFRPFENLVSRFTIPEIPQLAKGGIVSKPTIAQIGEAGSEAIIPLERNKAGLQMLSKLLAEEIKRNIAVSVGAYGNTGTNNVNYNYNFTQNNTSPKALSRSEIYRQTKNLIRAVKRS